MLVPNQEIGFEMNRVLLYEVGGLYQRLRGSTKGRSYSTHNHLGTPNGSMLRYGNYRTALECQAASNSLTDVLTRTPSQETTRVETKIDRTSQSIRSSPFLGGIFDRERFFSGPI